jgi:hypothetical protein
MKINAISRLTKTNPILPPFFDFHFFIPRFCPSAFSRPKFSFSVSITHARQSFLEIRIGSTARTSSSQTKKPNAQSALLCQYWSLPTIKWLYSVRSSRIRFGVRSSKLFTAATLAVAHTAPLLCFRNNLSPASTRPKGARRALAKRDSTRFRPANIASKYGLFKITR